MSWKNLLINQKRKGGKMISCFSHLKNPIPIEEIDIYEFLERLKNPSIRVRILIEQARTLKQADLKEDYDSVKEKLPCFTLNFSFKRRKSNDSIKEATGFIYLDVDGTLEVNQNHPLIFASWKSLSATGRGILVKVDGLNKENIKDTYHAISNELNIKADLKAAKATQFNVHSWDEDIYTNEDSVTWTVIDNVDNTPTSIASRERERKVRNELGEKAELRYDNINELDFKGKDYLVFPDEKTWIATAYIPKSIGVGRRNSILSSFSWQMRALNPHLSNKRFIKLIEAINSSCCLEPLGKKEVSEIASKALAIEDIKPILNTPRRIIFNPKCTLTNSEKRRIVNKITGTIRSKQTEKELKDIVQNWDKKLLGKITQKKLAEIASKNIKTIEKYYKHLKTEIRHKNKTLYININPFFLFNNKVFY